MGKNAKEHRKKVQARNQRLKREESTLMNLFKKMQETKNSESINQESESNKNQEI